MAKIKTPQLACALLALSDAVQNTEIKAHKSKTVHYLALLPFIDDIGIGATKENIERLYPGNRMLINRVLLSMRSNGLVHEMNKRFYLTAKGKLMLESIEDRFFYYLDQYNEKKRQ